MPKPFTGCGVTAGGFHVGHRVELHPGTDAWMRGDRYGEVIGFARSKRGGEVDLARVKMDTSGRTLRAPVADLRFASR